MTDELKTCPFCGGGGAGYMDDVQYPDTPNERVWYAVTCGHCDANGAWDLGKSGAVEKWNTRAVEDALRARILVLEAELGIVSLSADEVAALTTGVVEIPGDVQPEGIKRTHLEDKLRAENDILRGALQTIQNCAKSSC